MDKHLWIATVGLLTATSAFAATVYCSKKVSSDWAAEGTCYHGFLANVCVDTKLIANGYCDENQKNQTYKCLTSPDNYKTLKIFEPSVKGQQCDTLYNGVPVTCVQSGNNGTQQYTEAWQSTTTKCGVAEVVDPPTTP